MEHVKSLLMRRKRWVYGALSVLFHVLLLVFLLRPSPPEAPGEVSLSFRTAPNAEAIQPAPVAAGPVEAIAQTSEAEGRKGGPAPSPSQVTTPSTGGKSQLRALLATDLSALRASLIVPAAMASENHDAEGMGLSPVEPTCHLSDGAVEKLVNQGRGQGNRGSGSGARGSWPGTVCKP
jgi:hypothetical protein